VRLEILPVRVCCCRRTPNAARITLLSLWCICGVWVGDCEGAGGVEQCRVEGLVVVVGVGVG
jgi:hypothetical protein